MSRYKKKKKPSPPPAKPFFPPPEGWWEAAFHLEPSPSEAAGHRCGEKQMLTIVAYDITCPKRLQRVAKLCEDYGMRVQYSIFECRLSADQFDDFWLQLLDIINEDTDRLTAFKICTKCAREIRSAGQQSHTEKVVAFVF